ncbi:hypothetical protein EDB83DRAFT_2373120, partial [Lactarius deliciosus]
MASVQLVNVTDKIDNKVAGIDDGVRGVDVKVQVVNDNFKAVRRLQLLSSRRQGNRDGSEINPSTNGVDVDNVKRNQLRDGLRKWQSPPDPSTNHNIAGDRQHEGIAEWVVESNQFESWKVAGSLL